MTENGGEVSIGAHDYDEIFSRPGLYEQVFYQRLRCISPERVRDALLTVLDDNGVPIHERRLLDLGAGNGMVGELLPAARTVGLDISAAARDACLRDRPSSYDAYYVADLADPADGLVDELERWSFDLLTCVAALGFGDIPATAFARAVDLVRPGGWVAFTIRDLLMHAQADGGFADVVGQMTSGGTLEVHRLERFPHRQSVRGESLFYHLYVARKTGEVPGELVGRPPVAA